jgi:hypothetical protein
MKDFDDIKMHGATIKKKNFNCKALVENTLEGIM